VSIYPILALAAGTYAFRLAGPLLRERLQLTERVAQIMAISATTLLSALVATAIIVDGAGHFAGWSRVLSVGVGAGLAWRKAPFALVVIAAAATAAVLRYAGLP
jgi:branched-subunit amino acid transport protein